ncbi:MAG TPA: glycosyltransferase [Pyrinomonadaceae bacterium]|nr:glycosyltransferase [Pyrinomonadaceae bacterium]
MDWWSLLTILKFIGIAVGVVTAVYFIGSVLTLTIGSELTARRLRAEAQQVTGAGGDVRFVVILPMLREDSIVARTMGQFLKAIKNGLPVSVVVATTAREVQHRDSVVKEIEASLGNGHLDLSRISSLARTVLNEADAESFRRLLTQKPIAASRAQAFLHEHLRTDTGSVARKLLPELNQAAGREAFFHVEAPAEMQGKVGQMNAAVSFVKAQVNGDARKVYVGVYDADSTPDQRVFDALRRVVGKREAEEMAPPGIFQQVSCYCQNLSSLKGVVGAISFADAVAQTRWAVGFEYPLYEHYARTVQQGADRRLVYCVGHGCFVSLELLTRIGGFPTCSPNDDLALGYLASVAGIEVQPVPVLDFCDVAPNPFASIRQSRFWYLGSARFDKDIAFFRRQFGLTPSWRQKLLLYLDGRARCFFWAWRSMLWLAATLFALATQTWWLAALLLIAHILYVQGGFLHTLWLMRRLPEANERLRVNRLPLGQVLLAMLLTSVTFIVRGLGPMSASLGFKPPQMSKIER